MVPPGAQGQVRGGGEWLPTSGETRHLVHSKPKLPLDLAPLTRVPDLFTLPETERAMDCMHCSAAMAELETKPGFQAFHCPSCDFVIIESVRHDAQERESCLQQG
jgi:predicted RNA-binding Zn-ribbon protein involved in translation (DUF1610 family)